MRFLVLVCLSLVAILPGVEPIPQPPSGWYADTRELYAGIPVTVRFTPADQALADRCWQVLAAVEPDFNDWSEDSAIGRINAGGAGEYELNASLEEAFVLSERMHEATEGVFDITVGPLRRLWRGAERDRRWPTDAEIAAVRARVGTDGYRRTGSRLEVLKPGMQFDFGGVCKGLSVDRAVAILRQAGCTAALVQVGGETGCWGITPAGRPHRIGIPDPDEPDDLSRLAARMQDPGSGISGSTSGNYRNPIIVNGTPLYHVYDPRSGRPAPTAVLSSTVVFPGTGRNGEADCLAKTGTILPHDRFLRLITDRGGEAALLVRGADGRSIERVATPGFSRFLAPEHAP
jgi:thiamine biosynthesis lipoprotein